MHEHETESDGMPAWLDDAVSRLREPVTRSPDAIDAIMRAARESRLATSTPQRPRVWQWLTRPSLSPLATAALIVLMAGAALVVARDTSRDAASSSSNGTARHQFVLVAPGARSVSLVGDFNAWNATATPLQRNGSAWIAEVRLPPGRHVYAFVIDGERWVADESAPRAPVDEFGRPGSVILVTRDET